MSRVVYLNALQALDAALRHGSMRGAAEELGVTPAAVGQRIRALEEFTGTKLLERVQAGVRPTPAAEGVADALRRAFAELDQVAMRLNLDRDGQVRIACDPDLLAYWLRPRLDGFSALYPGIRLAFLADGDPAPADLSLLEGGPGEMFLPDWMIPVVSTDNLERVARIAGPFPVEGMPLLHVDRPARNGAEVGWPDWVARFPLRQTAADRGFRYRRWSDARNFARAGVALALVPLSLVADALREREIFHLFPTLPLIPARLGWRVTLHRPDRPRPNVVLFHDWLKDEAAKYLAALPPALPNGELAMETLAPSR